MPFFRIIMPNYNNSQWLDKSIGSVLGQTFKDYIFVFVDDVSTDDSVDKAGELIKDDGIVFGLNEKKWNGGSRNVGLEVDAFDTKYTLFLDSDDWLASPDILQKLHDFIVDEDYPECVRLAYICEYDGNKRLTVHLTDDHADKLAKSAFVACWTKCIKSDLVQPFPENTLMEDVVQHIRQCEVLNYDVAIFNTPVLVHNRNNLNSCTRKENLNTQNGKWMSSMYRYMADLLDLELTKPYCIAERDRRVSVWGKNYQAGKYTQSG